MLEIGLVGAGRIGSLHAANLVRQVERARLRTVADASGEAAQGLAHRLGVSGVAFDYRELLADPAIGAVLVCSPTDTHAEIVCAAAEAGKHVFVEKPIDHELSRTDQVLEAVQSAGVKLQVGFNRRFDPTFARVRQAVARGEVGDVHLLHIISRDPAPPPIAYVRVSGGLFADMMIHDLDMVRFLSGSEVTEVYTQAAVRIDPGIGEASDVDTAVVMLRFADGAIGTVENSRQAVYGYDQRVEILGSRGGISTQNIYPNQVTLSTAEHVRRDLPLRFFLERYRESYVAEVQAFVDAVLDDRPCPCSGEDGRRAMALAVAARQSLLEHQPVAL